MEKIFSILTKPCLSEMLLVSFNLWKETTFCIHCSPVEGLSGWMYILLGISGSAFPATIHRLQIKSNLYQYYVKNSSWSCFTITQIGTLWIYLKKNWSCSCLKIKLQKLYIKKFNYVEEITKQTIMFVTKTDIYKIKTTCYFKQILLKVFTNFP